MKPTFFMKISIVEYYDITEMKYWKYIEVAKAWTLEIRHP
jgi:hypothetical protein